MSFFSFFFSFASFLQFSFFNWFVIERLFFFFHQNFFFLFFLFSFFRNVCFASLWQYKQVFFTSFYNERVRRGCTSYFAVLYGQNCQECCCFTQKVFSQKDCFENPWWSELFVVVYLVFGFFFLSFLSVK